MYCRYGLTLSELHFIRNNVSEIIHQFLSPQIIIESSCVVDVLDYRCIDCINLYFKELSSCICSDKPLQNITVPFIISKFNSEVLKNQK